MTPAILSRAARLLEDRLVQLEQRVHQGDEGAWEGYVTTVNALVAVLAQLTPGTRGEFLTTKEMAERLNIAPKTLLRRKKKGLARPALQLGQRGRAAIRWRGDEVAR
jgi:hypothetical protein